MCDKPLTMSVEMVEVLSSLYEMLPTMSPEATVEVLVKSCVKSSVESSVESCVESCVESSKVAQLFTSFTFESMWTFAEEVVTKSTDAYTVIMTWFVETSIVF